MGACDGMGGILLQKQDKGSAIKLDTPKLKMSLAKLDDAGGDGKNLQSIFSYIM